MDLAPLAEISSLSAQLCLAGANGCGVSAREADAARQALALLKRAMISTAANTQQSKIIFESVGDGDEANGRAHKLGDRVRVVKVGTQHGKIAVVINPNWANGMVKVKMQEDTSIKSYQQSELAPCESANKRITDVAVPDFELASWRLMFDIVDRVLSYYAYV